MNKTYISDTISKVGEEVTLQGWVANRRDLGKMVFIDLRDSTGIIQVVADSGAHDVRNEQVLDVQGVVQERKLREGDTENIPVEIGATQVTIIATAETPPFPITSDGYEIDDTIRAKYRYLDLRRPRLQRNMKYRDTVLTAFRSFLHEKGFTEIETPLLTKTTPEGSRDFVVPSRLKKGEFYALPQSPQQYKQLLMVAGFEKYFQMARCMRDEDLRANRSFEHTQLDMEMSFVSPQDVMTLVEEAMISLCTTLDRCKDIKQEPFPVITYQEAMDTYGADSFDMRTDEEKENGVLAFAWVTKFPLFEEDGNGGWTFSHNPFSDPLPDHKEKLLAGEVEGIISTQYDLVCNGYELGGGSIRSSDPAVLEQVLRTIGHTDDEIKNDFGHMLEALSYGAPPHGGLAIGIERLLAILLNEENIREVVAFPMTYSGKTAVMDAPASLSDTQLAELGLSVSSE